MSAAKAITEFDRAQRDRGMRSRALAWAGPLILLAAVIGFFWKLVLTSQYTWLASFDLADQVLPWLNFEAQQFHLHHMPVWDPFLFGGQSLIGQGQPGLAYPLNWLLFSLPLHRGHINTDILNWYFLVIHYMAALFCYFLCRDLGRGLAASIIAGLAFGLGGYIGNTDWPQMINGAIWGPLILMFLFRAAHGVRPMASAAFSGLFLGMSWLAGHHQIPIFLSLTAGGLWLYFLLEDGRWNPSRLKPAAVFVVFAALTGALQMWPAYEYGHLALRWVGSPYDPIAWNQVVPYSVHQQFSLSPIYLLGILIPGYSQGYVPFMGVVAVAMASLALACWWKLKEVRIIFAIGVAGLFLALGKSDVFHGILYSIVPMFEKARSPGAAIYLFHLAIAVLVAFGLDAMFLSENRALVRRAAFLLLGFGGLVLLIIMGIDVGRAFNWGFDDRIVIVPFVALALGGLLFRFSRPEASRTWLPAMLGALLLMELGNQMFYWLPSKQDKVAMTYSNAFDNTRDVAAFLKRQPEPVRADVSREDVEFNFGDWYGIDAMEGVLPSLPASVCNLEFGTERTRLLYGCNYAVAKKPTMDGEQEVFRDANGLVVYKNPRALPRVWTVHQLVVAKNVREVQHMMQDSSFDLRTKAFGYEPVSGLQACDGDSVQFFSRGTNHTTAVVDMKCGGMVVESENYAPGWSATVDGRKTPIYQAYTALRGVMVGPGKHTIEMDYWPMSVIAGAFATFSAFLAALALCLVPRMRRDQNGV